MEAKTRGFASAKEYGIKITFENTEGLERFEALMKRFENDDTVGFCWDFGHEICYNYSKDLLAKYGDRFLTTHLNDNLGISRFDGKIFWTDDLHTFFRTTALLIGIKFINSKPLEILNFELNIRNKPNRYENLCYEKMTLEEYFSEIYKRACRFAYKMFTIKNQIG